jgi:hypothetical protein
MNVYRVNLQFDKKNRQTIVVCAANKYDAREKALSMVVGYPYRFMRSTQTKCRHADDAIWLTGLLARAGKTQKQFAAESGIHLSQISRWCCGRVKMGRDNFDRIAKLLA